MLAGGAEDEMVFLISARVREVQVIKPNHPMQTRNVYQNEQQGDTEITSNVMF